MATVVITIRDNRDYPTNLSSPPDPGSIDIMIEGWTESVSASQNEAMQSQILTQSFYDILQSIGLRDSVIGDLPT